MTRRLWLVGLLVLVLVAGGWGARRASGLREGNWVKVERGDLVVEVELSGALKAEKASILGPPLIQRMWEFKLAFLVPEGTEVEAGTPVLGFDDSQLRHQLEERQNEGDQAQKELEQKSAELARSRDAELLRLAEVEAKVRKLRLETEVPAELKAALERDQKRLELELAEREVSFLQHKIEHQDAQAKAELEGLASRRDRARARVAELKADIGRLMVLAPTRGTVLYAVEGGEERPKVGDSVWQGRSLVEIPDLSAMIAEAQADETDLGRLAVGRPVRVTLDAFPDAEYPGRVTAIGGSIVAAEGGLPVKVIAVTVKLERTDPERMRPGMRFRGRVEVERQGGVLLVPLDAVAMTAAGPRLVRRGWLRDDEIQPALGRQSGGKVEILAGLSEGDEVRRP